VTGLSYITECFQDLSSQCFIPFLFGRIMCPCMGIPHFVISLSVGGHLGCFRLLDVMTNAMNISIWIFMWMCSFSVVELLGHMVTRLTCWGSTRLLYKVAAPFYVPLAVKKGSKFSTSSIFMIICLFYFSQPSDYEVACHLIHISLMMNDVKHLFMFSLAICVSSLG